MVIVYKRIRLINVIQRIKKHKQTNENDSNKETCTTGPSRIGQNTFLCSLFYLLLPLSSFWDFSGQLWMQTHTPKVVQKT